MVEVDLKMSTLDMRDAFFDGLYDIAKADPKVMLLTADMGAYSFKKFKKELPGQFINVGVAEQNMVSISAGLTLGGRKAFIYTIIPFVTLRCYEQVKIDLCCMNLPVTIVGVGPGLTYGSDGPTHHATQDIAVMRALPEMTILNPCDPYMSAAFAGIAYRAAGPSYVRIDKGRVPEIYAGRINDFSDGLSELRQGSQATIIATGIMVQQALKVAQELKRQSLSVGVVDLYRIKPMNEKMLLGIIDKSRRIVTLEENSIIGGIGSLVAELLGDHSRSIPLKRLAIPDGHCFVSGSRECLWAHYGLDKDSLVKQISGWINIREGDDGSRP